MPRCATGWFGCASVRRWRVFHDQHGLDHLILWCSTPVDDTTSLFTFVIWGNDDFSVPGQEVIAFDRAIGAEDKVLLEQTPGVLPLDRRRARPVTPSELPPVRVQSRP